MPWSDFTSEAEANDKHPRNKRREENSQRALGVEHRPDHRLRCCLVHRPPAQRAWAWPVRWVGIPEERRLNLFSCSSAVHWLFVCLAWTSPVWWLWHSWVQPVPSAGPRWSRTPWRAPRRCAAPPPACTEPAAQREPADRLCLCVSNSQPYPRYLMVWAMVDAGLLLTHDVFVGPLLEAGTEHVPVWARTAVAREVTRTPIPNRACTLNIQRDARAGEKNEKMKQHKLKKKKKISLWKVAGRISLNAQSDKISNNATKNCNLTILFKIFIQQTKQTDEPSQCFMGNIVHMFQNVLNTKKDFFCGQVKRPNDFDNNFIEYRWVSFISPPN